MLWSIRVWGLLICLSILVFQECCSLFLRNTQTGKCITTERFGSSAYAGRYFAILTDKCLHNGARFRYLKEYKRTELLYNIERSGTLASLYAKSSVYKERVFIYEPKSWRARAFAFSTQNSVKQTNGAIHFYKADVKSCAEPDANNEYLNDNQNIKECGKAEQQFTFGSVTSYKEQMENVDCSSLQKMLVRRSDYGDFDKNDNLLDYDATIDTNCSAITNCEVKARCGGKTSCQLTFDGELLPAHYCPADDSMEIYTEYTCVDNYPATLTSGRNIKLSEVYQGKIEIKSSSKWIVVEEKNWNKERERMLCQYLGFDETSSSTDNVGHSIGQDVASGDLICYNTLSSGLSCCVNLEIAVTAGTVRIPYAKCKLKTCDNPILQDNTLSSDSVFSGYGSPRASDYKKARFYNSGWCPTRFGIKYLMIDLQKDYHIKQVIVLGDMGQTKWSKLYSLKYSHTESLVDNSTAQNVNGNGNGYEASYTTLNIYNARYLKIQSTDFEDFCLRIELCGEGQVPAPVYNLTVTPKVFSAEVTWSLKEKESSSYITHYIIHIDGKKLRRVSRSQRGATFKFDSLKAVTDYTIGIQTQDSASQKSAIITKHFSTKEGAPSGAPLGVALKSRSKRTIELSYKPPEKSLWNAHVLTGYQICYAIPAGALKCESTSKLSYTIKGLQPSTQYIVTVAAETRVGLGKKSTQFRQITKGEPIIPVPKSYSSLSISISKPANYIKSAMVVVQMATNNPKSSEDINVNDLKPHEANTSDPYIAAHLKANDLPSTFIVGDGKHYIYKNKNYSNSPLDQNMTYIIFLRCFESLNFFYSTEWSSGVKTMIKPPAPVILNPRFIGFRMYNIIWSQPSLPAQQTILMYYIKYNISGGPQITLNVSKATVSYNISVDSSELHIFAVQVETEAGKSDFASVSTRVYSGPLDSPEKINGGYSITLREPDTKDKIQKVALILLQLQSSSSEIPLPGGIAVQDSQQTSANTTVFLVKEFDIAEFQEGPMQIFIQEKKSSRSKREIVQVFVELGENVTFHAAQRNQDKFGNYFWTDWSPSFTFAEAVDGGDDFDSEKHNDNESGSGAIFAAIGVSSCVTVIVVILVFLFIFFRRRRAQKHSDKHFQSQENHIYEEMKVFRHAGNKNFKMNLGPPANEALYEDIYSNETGFEDQKEHPPVPVRKFARYVKEMKENDNAKFHKELNDLPKNIASWEVSKRPYNRKKNRFGNCVTYDHCRVILTGNEKEDYINASYIDGVKENSYIACQAPNKQTVNDMWRMIWEQRCYSIIMVTPLIELGKPKCEKYWPDQGTSKYGDLEVTLMRTEKFAYHVTRTFQITKDDDEREVKHYYFLSWPDHSVPKYSTQLLAFRRYFRTLHLKQSGPIVVHSSAGIGRTGVFVTIDAILEKLDKGVISSIDVFGQVSAMRERRMNMVQSLEQYVFIHEAILETILFGLNEVDSTRIKKEIESLRDVKANGMTGFQEKFKKLGAISATCLEKECRTALLEKNYDKNRNKKIYPADCYRVPLQCLEGMEKSDYINAVFVHVHPGKNAYIFYRSRQYFHNDQFLLGYLRRNCFIATQSPLPNTITDFWQMVYMQKSSTIVLLNNVKEGTSFPIFWPQNRGKPTQYGSLTVHLDFEAERDGIWTRKLILLLYPDLSDGQVVNVFHYTKWPDHKVPRNADGVITLMSLVEKSCRQSHGQGPVIVACSDGAGRTGTYIAISNLLERMKIEQAVDVFQSIKIIRDHRQQFVENAEQYEFCYNAMASYLDGFSDYANFA